MKTIRITLFTLAAATALTAETANFQLSLVPDVAIQERDTTIEGISIGVWNENPGTQWQLGFVNGATGESVGLQWFLFLPTFYNYAETFTGVQFAVVNYTSEKFIGWQGGFVNIAAEMTGLQWGFVNYCEDLTGLQLGFVNYAQHASAGVQIGLANIIAENEWFSDGDLGKGFIFVNWGF